MEIESRVRGRDTVPTHSPFQAHRLHNSLKEVISNNLGKWSNSMVCDLQNLEIFTAEIVMYSGDYAKLGRDFAHFKI